MTGLLTVEATDGAARAGTLRLAHATVQTPVFMPVGTQASVKTLICEDLEGLGYNLILGNTYHLWLRPGIDSLEEAGGLHRFMSWKGGILTDSGGFQVFSLANRREVSEEGVVFSSHVDGARHHLTPETVVSAQMRMGVDIAMCLDECPPYPCSETEARDMMERTLRWAARAKEAWSANAWHGHPTALAGSAAWERPAREQVHGLEAHATSARGIQNTHLFPIVQGATFPALRKESARRTVELELPGYALGGLSVGEPRDLLGPMIEASVGELPKDKPRYLMGVGRPEDMLEAVERGIDMFDCVWPTRNGRNGQALTSQGPLNLRTNACRRDDRPLDEACSCPICARYTRRYIAHLFRAGEYAALRMVSLHNLAFMLDFTRRIRESISVGRFLAFKEEFLERYSSV